MAAYEIEIILNRQLADSFLMPVFIIDPSGNLIYYNEPAEQVLGKRFDETGEMPVEVWSTIFKPMDEAGNLLPPDELPLVMTLKNATPYHKSFRIRSLNGKLERIALTSLPIQNRASKFLGAVAIFWELKDQ
ncbi:MAG: PAS domain-containing protein [Chitinophagaceae bacterium]